MEIQITCRKKIPGLKTLTIKRTLKKVLEDLACCKGELSVLFTDDVHIALLNREYRGKDRPTNVLAFPMAGGPPDVESGMLGDIVISVDTALRESEEAGETLETTINRLLVHGLLHLLGYDHERSAKDERIMSEEEARIARMIKEETDGETRCKH
jgi:probable rRNA maturation factor